MRESHGDSLFSEAIILDDITTISGRHFQITSATYGDGVP